MAKTSTPIKEESRSLVVAIERPIEYVCGNCEHWSRTYVKGSATSFGTCMRWTHLMVEDRGGVQATPFQPLTPSRASCDEFEPVIGN